MEILNDNDKAQLRIFSRYIRSHGMKNGVIDFEVDYGGFNMEDKNSFSNNWTAEIPEFIKPVLQKIIDSFEGQIEFLDDYSFNNFELDIDSVDQVLTASQSYGYYERGDEQTTEWNINDDPDEIPQLFDILESSGEDLERILTLRYNGAGDSGYLENEFEEDVEVPRDIEDWCYRQLESLHGGWEINEGSDGEFIFDTEKQTIELRHAFNEEQTDHNVFFEINFGK